MALLDGKVGLVTGAGAGIGRAAALKCAQEGAKVMVADVNEDGAAQTVEMIEEAGGEAAWFVADVSRAEDVKALVAKTVERFGGLDYAYNNAGIEGKVVPLMEQSEENFDRIIAVNLKGVFLCMKYEIEQMLKNGGGAIVNVASVAGLIGFPGLSPYVASKHGVNGLTKNAALEYSKFGIRVNSICPGGIDTRMLDSLADQTTGGKGSSSEVLGPLHPIGRIGEPEEVAELVVWLCSPRASFVTGANIPIDGGFVAQ